MKQIQMAGPDVTEDDVSIEVEALRNGWYGENAYYYVETFEFLKPVPYHIANRTFICKYL